MIGSNHQEIKPGDVVFIHDDTTRANWKMAVIESVKKGADGKIRSANICTPTGRTNCPVARLYPLELSENTTTSIPADGGPEQSMMSRNFNNSYFFMHAYVYACMLGIVKNYNEHVLWCPPRCGS